MAAIRGRDPPKRKGRPAEAAPFESNGGGRRDLTPFAVVPQASRRVCESILDRRFGDDVARLCARGPHHVAEAFIAIGATFGVRGAVENVVFRHADGGGIRGRRGFYLVGGEP